MKMKPEDFTALKDMLEEWLKTSPNVKDHERSWDALKEHYTDNGMSMTRFRHDMLWFQDPTKRREWFDRGIYSYLNDTHIGTALKAIVG